MSPTLCGDLTASGLRLLCHLVTTATSSYCWEEKSFNYGERGSKTTAGFEAQRLQSVKTVTVILATERS